MVIQTNEPFVVVNGKWILLNEISTLKQQHHTQIKVETEKLGLHESCMVPY